VRAVLDPNVLVAALLSRDGTPARLVRSWLDGAFELVVSDMLLTELERALAYPTLEARIAPDDARAFVALLRARAALVGDPTVVEPRSADPDDDYLIALAERATAYLVSGDRHLLALSGSYPIVTASAFADLI